MTQILHLALCVIIIFGKNLSAELQCDVGEIKENCPATCASDYCPTHDKQDTACPQPDTCPAPACKCRFNYRRAENGTCIPTESCPPFDCSHKPNEEYVPCPSYCPTDDCNQATPSGECPFAGFILMTVECNPTCRCVKNFWRQNGVCVPYPHCFS